MGKIDNLLRIAKAEPSDLTKKEKFAVLTVWVVTCSILTIALDYLI